MNILKNFIGRVDFTSYEDFKRNYSVSCPDDFNFAVNVVDEWAKIEPLRRALVFCDDEGNSRTFNFSEISQLSKKAASYLISLGIKKGDRVMLILKRHYDYWITAIALHRIGAILIPAPYQLASKDIIYRANAAKIRMIIAANDPWVIEQIEEAKSSCSSVEFYALSGQLREGFLDYTAGYQNAPADYIRDETLRSDDIMLLYFTSGTTGMPKMVLHDFTYPLGHMVTAGYWQSVLDGGLHLTVADSGWAKFSWGSIYGQWICGCAILGYNAPNKFNVKNLIHIISTYKPTTLCVPGTIYRFMMNEGLTAKDFSSVKHCTTAGEPLAPEIIRAFRTITGLTIHEGFGQSESSVMLANFPYFEPRFGSMGKPSPLYDIAVVDENGDECPDGVVGEIVVRSLEHNRPRGLFIGYLKDENILSIYDKNYVYHTGDTAWRDEDNYYWFVGRNDDMIKCSGYRIGPFEIESVLLTHKAVNECAITAAPDPIRGQIVKATIVLSSGFLPSRELTKELQDYVKKMTAPYKYPRIVEYASELPKTTSGKIIRSALRKG